MRTLLIAAVVASCTGLLSGQTSSPSYAPHRKVQAQGQPAPGVNPQTPVRPNQAGTGNPQTQVQPNRPASAATGNGPSGRTSPQPAPNQVQRNAANQPASQPT